MMVRAGAGGERDRGGVEEGMTVAVKGNGFKVHPWVDVDAQLGRGIGGKEAIETPTFGHAPYSAGASQAQGRNDVDRKLNK